MTEASVSTETGDQPAGQSALSSVPSQRVLPPWPIALGLGLVIAVIYGWVSLQFGQDTNWDLLNYHFYNPWSFENGRLGQDIAPGQLQTYLNPLLDLPAYWLISNFSPRVVGAVMGAIHGLNTWMLALISWAIFRQLAWQKRLVLSLSATIFGALGLEAVDLIGRTTNDNLVSLFVFAALLVLVSAQDRPSFKRWAISGLLLGAGTGLKLTVGIHAVAFGILAALAPGSLVQRIQRVAVAGFSGLAGVVASAGYWTAVLLEQFSSPLFPFWNGLFKSPYFVAKTVDFYSYVSGPGEGLVGQLLFPFHFAADPTMIRTAGSDYRFAAALVVTLLVPLLVMARRSRLDWMTGGLIVFCLVSYCSWQALFHYGRMLLVVEILVGLYILAVTTRALGESWRVVIATLLLLVGLTSIQQYDRRGRAPWQQDFFGVIASKDVPKNAMVLITSRKPLGYIAPHFPAELRWLHIEGNLQQHIRGTRFESWLKTEIAQHQGPILALAQVRPELPPIRKIGYGMNVDTDRCLKINKRFFRDFQLCHAWRTADAEGAQNSDKKLSLPHGQSPL